MINLFLLSGAIGLIRVKLNEFNEFIDFVD